MPVPAADPNPAPGSGKAAGRLAWLAGAACAACCALPALVAAGLLGGAAAGAATWMPTAAIVLAVASAVVLAAGHLRASEGRVEPHTATSQLPADEGQL
jgi:hypothetical protein